MSFFSVGADRQRSTINRAMAEKQLQNSCVCCLRKNIHMDCDCCPINEAYMEKMDEFDRQDAAWLRIRGIMFLTGK